MLHSDYHAVNSKTIDFSEERIQDVMSESKLLARILLIFVMCLGEGVLTGFILGFLAFAPLVGIIIGTVAGASVSPLFILSTIHRGVLATFVTHWIVTAVITTISIIISLDAVFFTYLISIPVSLLFSYSILPSITSPLQHCCQICGYDLRFIPSPTCPECGSQEISSMCPINFDEAYYRVVSSSTRTVSFVFALLSLLAWFAGCAYKALS